MEEFEKDQNKSKNCEDCNTTAPLGDRGKFRFVISEAYCLEENVNNYLQNIHNKMLRIKMKNSINSKFEVLSLGQFFFYQQLKCQYLQ